MALKIHITFRFRTTAEKNTLQHSQPLTILSNQEKTARFSNLVR